MVLVLVLWVVALKPSNSPNSANGTGGGLGQYQSAINAAKGVQGTVNRAGAAAVGATTPAATPTPSSAAKTAPAGTTHASTTHASAAAKTSAAKTSAAKTSAAKTSAAKTATAKTVAPKAPAASATPAARQLTVVTALRAGKVVALVFYNPGAADDRAVTRELRSIPGEHGKVVSLAIPITELSNYPAVTNQVPVSVSPTLVFIDRAHYATTIVGYASRFEIAQRIADALAAK
jgi:hypothetical protein